MKEKRKIIGRYIPISVIVLLVIALVSGILLVLSSRYTALADILSGSVGAFFRYLLGVLTSLLPFSIFEVICILLLPLVTVAVILALTSRADTTRRVRSIFLIVGVISAIFTSYVYTLGVGYHTTKISERLGLDIDVGSEEIIDTAEAIVTEVNLLAESLGLDGVSTLPMTERELSLSLSSSFSDLPRELGSFSNIPTLAKPIRLSGIMSDAGITGIYSFFTGEANYNTAYPDYYIPFTVAHELAHQRGISREDEANFVAYLVSISSPNDYIRYSGYLNLLEYFLSAVYRTDEDKYISLYSRINESAIADMRAAREVYIAHADTPLGRLTDRANDAYLKLNGTEGVVSYGLVVRLVSAYHASRG